MHWYHCNWQSGLDQQTVCQCRQLWGKPIHGTPHTTWIVFRQGLKNWPMIGMFPILLVLPTRSGNIGQRPPGLRFMCHSGHHLVGKSITCRQPSCCHNTRIAQHLKFLVFNIFFDLDSKPPEELVTRKKQRKTYLILQGYILLPSKTRIHCRIFHFFCLPLAPQLLTLI